MAEEQVLKVVITADDKATGKLGKVGAGLKKLSIIAAAAAVAGVAILAGAFVKLGIEALAAGGDAQEMLSKLDATFGDAGDSLTETLTQFSADAGRSRFQLLGMATDLGAVAKALGFSEETAADMSVAITKLSTDVGSFNNMPSEEVAQRFTRALTGEFESLKALGIVINEQTLNQELLNQGVEDGTKAATAQEKALAVSAILFQQTSDAQGDAIKTSGSWTNIMIRLKATLSDVVTEIGLKLIPVLTPLAKMFGDLATNAVPIVADIFDNVLIPALQLLVLTFQRLVAGNFAGAIRGLFPPEIATQILGIMEVMQPLFDFLSANLIPILIAIGGVVAALVVAGLLAMTAAAFAFIAPFLPIVAAVAAVIAIGAALVAAWRNDFGGMRTALTKFWTNSVKPAFDQIVAFLKVFIPAAITTLVGFWQNSLLPAIQAVWGFIQTSLIPLFLAVADVLSASVGKGVEALAGLWQNVLLPVMTVIWDWIKSKLIPIFEAVGDIVNWLTVAIFGNWKKSFDGIIGAIEIVIGWLKDLADSIAAQELPWWLTPGSPTPFELGLVGIANALKDINNLTPSTFAFAPVAPGGVSGALVGGPGIAAGLGGPGGATIILNYAPTLSTASEDELREKLKPILERMGLSLG